MKERHKQKANDLKIKLKLEDTSEDIA